MECKEKVKAQEKFGKGADCKEKVKQKKSVGKDENCKGWEKVQRSFGKEDFYENEVKRQQNSGKAELCEDGAKRQQEATAIGNRERRRAVAADGIRWKAAASAREEEAGDNTRQATGSRQVVPTADGNRRQRNGRGRRPSDGRKQHPARQSAESRISPP